MIGRVWRGWADEVGAAAYEAHFHEEVQGTLAAVPGCHGGYLLRHDSPDGVEFVTLTLFDSLDAVRLRGRRLRASRRRPRRASRLARLRANGAALHDRGRARGSPLNPRHPQAGSRWGTCPVSN
jgi:hypothetical protein